MVFSQVANGILLPFVLIFMLLLTNDSELMGEHVNSRRFNVIAWFVVISMIGLTLAMLLTQKDRFHLGLVIGEWLKSRIGSRQSSNVSLIARITNHQCSIVPA